MQAKKILLGLLLASTSAMASDYACTATLADNRAGDKIKTLENFTSAVKNAYIEEYMFRVTKGDSNTLMLKISNRTLDWQSAMAMSFVPQLGKVSVLRLNLESGVAILRCEANAAE